MQDVEGCFDLHRGGSDTAESGRLCGTFGQVSGLCLFKVISVETSATAVVKPGPLMACTIRPTR
ncbi:hypothetical protein CGQ36_20810 [Nocardiopsis dassonvillei]|nr:hypothetical protein CGQ36_20810 [Nocardiopsis dassonvillei]